MAPQIRLVQGNDTMMAEKIQSTIVNTIPLWKSQMVLALGVTHSGQAAKAKAEAEYGRFNKTQQITSDFDHEIKRLIEKQSEEN